MKKKLSIKNGVRLVSANDGYGNIDTSQLWVADEDGNPYGTLYRLVKDETNNHIELMSADTVLDPDVDYDNTDPIRITPYTKDGKEYAALADLAGLNDFEKADIVWNWFKMRAQEIISNTFPRKIWKQRAALTRVQPCSSSTTETNGVL
ncbi:MAG: hypothetical protein V8S08_10260 [Lachnoclostridium sp.]